VRWALVIGLLGAAVVGLMLMYVRELGGPLPILTFIVAVILLIFQLVPHKRGG
jgi:hypothetical protein